MVAYKLTTVDNPSNPFTDYENGKSLIVRTNMVAKNLLIVIALFLTSSVTINSKKKRTQPLNRS